ncbi:MAG: cation diffusion facilitator family transporter [Eggerthellaceae bacterium]|nr:cation diffusion facilitator family transporter [Eggerthellaceae bacterium]
MTESQDARSSRDGAQTHAVLTEPANPLHTALPDGQGFRGATPATEHESRGSVIAAIAANIAVGIVKLIAAAVSGSSAMISEGIHSIVDSGNGMLVLLGQKRSSRQADLEHPFGYGHELYFWTLVVAVMIFALGGGLSIYEGIARIREIGPDTVLGDPTVSYVVIVAAMLIEGASLRVALKSFNKARGEVRPLTFIKQAKDPSLFTVVLEDSAAELGLVFALLGIFLSHALNMPVFDGIASVLVGLLLVAVSTLLLRETKGLLVGEGMRAPELREVEAIAERNPYVIECGRILTLYLGPNDMLLTMDVTFKKECTRDDIMQAIDQIEGQIVRRFPQTTRIFIESESLRFTYEQAEQAAALGASKGDSRSDIHPRPGIHRVV